MFSFLGWVGASVIIVAAVLIAVGFYIFKKDVETVVIHYKKTNTYVLRYRNKRTKKFV